jgi:hypothetical protein
LPNSRPLEEQVANIGTGDQQNEADCSQQNQQFRPYIAD